MEETMRQERVIVSLTTWKKRINNIPTVLDTILAQTVKPDRIVLNLAYNESIPADVQKYIDINHIELNYTSDTKVYKKLLPTLEKYPDDVVISIDDDWLYPQEMIADFIDIHSKYPNNPVSGNRVIYSGMQCHCGCASLTKKEYFGSYFDKIDAEVMKNCPSDDITYTFFATKAGHPYLTTKHQYFVNLTPFNDVEGYSEKFGNDTGIETSLLYLTEKFGNIPCFIDSYIPDPFIAEIVGRIYHENTISACHTAAQAVRATKTYKIGRILTQPRRFIKKLWQLKK